MSKKKKSLLVILLTLTLLMITKGFTAYAYIGSNFNYTYEGQTISYTVLSEPTETENGTAQVIYSKENNDKLAGKVMVPATVTNQRMTYDVIGIENNSFIEADGITSITLPETITFLGEDAFYGCDTLASINIPHGVTRIEKGTFQGCSNLVDIHLPDGLTNIGNNAFYNCNSLVSINLPEGLTYIGTSSFYNCSKLIAIEFPSKVNYLGAGAFEGCSSLANINIPEGITAIEDKLFKDCISLTSVSMPEGVKRIGRSAFYNCSSLISIHLSDDITSIGEYAFYLCTSLTSIKIPYSVTKIEDFTFLGCSNLAKVRIQDKVISIGNYAFYKCSSLVSISLPEGLTSIGNWSFYGCESARPIKIPATVTGMGYGDLPYCGVLVYHNSYAETFFQKYHPEYYQIIQLPLEEMSFPEKIMNIRVNDIINLKPFFYPAFSSDITDTIQWSSSDQSIITVDGNGTVKGLKAGEADITAVMGKYSATCHIIADGVTINPSFFDMNHQNIEMKRGDSVKLQLDFSPIDSTNQSITWTSSDTSVVTVENGRIYAKNNGTAFVTATSTAASVAPKACKVTVYSPLKEIFSDYNTITINKGETKRIAISYSPMDTTQDKTVIWRSENESVATIENGVIKAVNPGNTTIIATVGALTHNIPVNVQNPLKSLSITQKEISLTVGQTQLLPLVILPNDTTDKIIITSSDETVATYSSGTITALKRGKATITAVGGSTTVSCTVTVGTDIESITLDKNNLTLYLGKSDTPSVNFNPINAKDDRTISWVSSDESVVTVDSDGVIKTVGTGTATITATAGGSRTASCNVVVKLSIPASLKVISLSYNSVKLTWKGVSGVSGYRIYRADSKTGTYIRIKDTISNSYINQGLITGKTYYYKVRAYRYQGTKKVYSSYSTIVSAVPVPSTPDNVQLIKLRSDMINFTWNQVSGASGYEIARTSSIAQPFKVIKSTTGLHYMNYGLTKGRTYYYKVRAYKIVGKQKVYSKFSSVFSLKI